MINKVTLNSSITTPDFLDTVPWQFTRLRGEKSGIAWDQLCYLWLVEMPSLYWITVRSREVKRSL